MKYDFGIFGGDMRQIYMGNKLKEAGYRILYYGTSREEGTVEEDIASSFFECLDQSEVWLGPIPLSRDGKKICQKGEKEDLTMARLAEGMERGGTLIAGCIPGEWKDRKWNVRDYMEDEVLTSFNSIATAEGAIALAITESQGNLRGSRCLVTGFGVCAATLASCLDGLKARVTVCARREEARQAARTAGYEGVSMEEMEEILGECDYIFNTVPALVFGREELKRIPRHTVLLDIASAPGGVDYEWASGLGIHARLCPGLPGIYAPRASAEAMASTVLRMKRRETVTKDEPELRVANIRESDFDVFEE